MRFIKTKKAKIVKKIARKVNYIISKRAAIKSPQLVGWTPIELHLRRPQPVVEWCNLHHATFTEPFFKQTVARYSEKPFVFLPQTPIEVLGELYAANPGLPPAGFIFHVSRCGSTLLSQMLAALPQNLVISEARPINAVLRSKFHDPEISDHQRLIWLQWMVSALGRPQQSQQKHYFIKFTSWNVLDLSLIQQAFPNTPWVFVYRDPVEVMVSVLKLSPGWMQSQGQHTVASLLGLDTATVGQMPREEYAAQVLASFCQTVLQHYHPNALLLNYQELPAVAWSSLLDWLQIDYTAADVDRMHQISQFNTKDPTKHFTGDILAKRQKASKFAHQMADQWVFKPYEQLETIRLAQRIRS